MKNILTTLTMLLLSLNLMAQSPNKLSYQAVVRNSSNALIVNQQVGVKVSVLQGSANGTAVYTETHTPTTNANGLISIEIGGGVITADSINKINWANGPYFIKTEIDPNGGNNYSITGITQLLSVPYALHARTADSIVGGTNFSGNYNDLTNKPITISNIVGDTFKLSNGGYILSAKSVNSITQPTIITNPVTNITTNGARLTGSVVGGNNSPNIVSKYILISNTPNPNPISGTLYMLQSIDTVLITGLMPGTTYFVRTLAITESNTYLYGNQISFTTQSVGQQGPAGGTVFFDKGDTIGGWRYLEAASTDQSSEIQWGCTNANAIATDTKIGSGAANTLMIVNSCNDTSFAAKLCNDLVLGGKSDWFLPASEELSLMISNLWNSFDMGQFYWSSSDYGTVIMSNGAAWTAYKSSMGSCGGMSSCISNSTKSQLLRVRAIRRF